MIGQREGTHSSNRSLECSEEICDFVSGTTLVNERIDKNFHHNHLDDQGHSALHRAIINGEYDEVRELLSKKDIDLNHRNYAGETALMLSLFAPEGNCYFKMAIWLLEAGAIFEPSERDRVILEQLIKNEAWKLAYSLVDKGLKVDKVDGSGRTLLHKASNENDLAVVKQLLGLGANPNVQDDQSLTPLHLAALRGHHPIISILTRNHAQPHLKDQYGRTPLHIGIQKGFVQVCRALIETGIGLEETNTISKTALTLVLEVALENNFDDSSCQIILLLLQKRAKLQKNMLARSFDILLGVLKVNQLELFEQLVKAGLNINAQNSSSENLLQTMTKRQPVDPAPNSEDLISKMISLGGSVTHKDRYGNSVLHCVQNKRDALTFIAQGLEIENANNEGLTPLFIAAQNQREGVCEALLTKKPCLYRRERQENVMHVAKVGDRHNSFSRWLKSQITLSLEYLKQIEDFFFTLFERAKLEAEYAKKNLTVLVGEYHGDFHIYQVETALMKAAQRASIANLYIEYSAAEILKRPTHYMPLRYAFRHTNFNVIGVDNYRSQRSENAWSIDCSESGSMFRELGISEAISEIKAHGIGIFGAAHLEGLISRPGTRLDLNESLVIPINLSKINSVPHLSSKLNKEVFYENIKNVIQIDRNGFNENEAYDVIQKWNGVNLRLTHPRPRGF